MNIRFPCPACEHAGRLEVPGPAEWHCRVCDHVLRPTSGLYGLPVDINLDGKVDGTDLALIASKFGRQVP